MGMVSLLLGLAIQKSKEMFKKKVHYTIENFNFFEIIVIYMNLKIYLRLLDHITLEVSNTPIIIPDLNLLFIQ